MSLHEIAETIPAAFATMMFVALVAWGVNGTVRTIVQNHREGGR